MQSRSLLALVTSSMLATLLHKKTRDMCVCQVDFGVEMCPWQSPRRLPEMPRSCPARHFTWHHEMASQDNQTVGSSQPGHGLLQFEHSLVLIEPG